ncbi:hypothetical protein CANARDRAFT_174046 [[Candida] arabinofermentans NRRL YB-2248]|uniref:Association with the SNF1 complex (ASC) domain-containing protein n=1 Tax=[Candida] arabinofermentans NRRL YB-2248 TaxID=983967 RepID=A0A1E4T8Y2_9ASCO|nr:hypothetical protein CANARDRAFT_174046 [[Candida] arabinofermentans NRRL YB-2248]
MKSLGSFSYIENIHENDLISIGEVSNRSSFSSSCESCQNYLHEHHHHSDDHLASNTADQMDTHHRNISAVFFSEDPDDKNVEQDYNEVPLASTSSASSSSTTGECHDYFGSDTGLTPQPGRREEPENPDQMKYLSMSTTSLADFDFHEDDYKPKKPEYTTEIPDFYLPEKLNYPYSSPYQYSDSEFEKMNHFDFLKTLSFQEPPLLPPYLNSNLLNDSATHNYKAYPYQYQDTNHIFINDQYRYNINDLNMMDKYSRQPHSKSIRKEIKQKVGAISPGSIMKHADYIENAEIYDVPNHVMLNHLITCNVKMDDVMIGSCIHRYSGKFITQIVYFPLEI